MDYVKEARELLESDAWEGNYGTHNTANAVKAVGYLLMELLERTPKLSEPCHKNSSLNHIGVTFCGCE